MPKILLEDIKNMIIQEMKTTSPYYGDEHHEKFDFRLAPYDNFINSLNNLIERLKDDLDRDDLTANELQFLRDDMLERAQDGFDYVLQAVELKLKNLNDSQDEEV
jgi:hypothetical protein|tara:strand:+ start:355 stop:669 length:315 start_codon:yes stop_codon:yes gene_type:complete